MIKISQFIVIRKSAVIWNVIEELKNYELIIFDEISTKIIEALKEANVLLISNEKSDLKLALDHNLAFFPIITGHELDSWNLFKEEALKLVFTNMYKVYQESIIEAFKKE